MTPYDHDHASFEVFEYAPKPHLDTPVAEAVPPGTGGSRTRLIRRIGVGTIAVLGGMLAIGGVQHFRTHEAAEAALQSRQNAVPKVRVQPVKVDSSPRDLSLPGTTSAFDTATIYARQSGYVAKREVDIGSKVKAGDVLAVIAAPEIDDQLNQARAQLLQMQASLKQAEASKSLAKLTEGRTAELVRNGWQSIQQGDTDRVNLETRTAGVSVAEANIVAQQAQVARLEKLQSYERIVAPFDGVITQRSIDIGSLVTADSTAGTSMFQIAHTDVLRVQVYVPQEAAFGIKDGVVATLQVPEIPGRTFTGRVARTADALQAGTRTLLVEVDIDNPDGALTAGLYCTVKFEVPRAKPVIEIPAEALIFNRDGTQVAVYDNGKARIRKVSIGEDDGDHLSIATGLAPGDQVIVSLPVDLTDGALVAIRPVLNAALPRSRS
jgi:RND family efflux transporter MFP subunit